MNFPFPVWWCRWVPVSQLNLRRNIDGSVKTEWWAALREDIRRNGLASPLLVLHYANEPLLKPVPMSVKVGQNRLRILRELGWKYAPCIIVGRKGESPPEGLELTPLRTLPEVQALLGDGTVGWEKYESLRINGTKVPEHKEYPQTKVRYFDAD